MKHFAAALASMAPIWAAACVDCHKPQAEALARSGMGRSFRVAAADLPGGRFVHALSKTSASVSGTTHTVGGLGQEIRYVVGSGNVGSSFLMEDRGALFQSPISYYSARKAWAVSPGYEHDRVLDFTRPVTPECLFCHAGGANPVKGSMNRFLDPPAPLGGIPCERCHGPGASHATNPAKLAGSVRAGVCEQCHLGGEVRVLNPGRRWEDFTPGQPVENIFTTYVGTTNVGAAGGGPLRVVSHVEQLGASRCAQASEGRMWCGSCHKVHGTADYRASCMGCHAGSQHASSERECTACHMPRRETVDGGHTVFTDHRIRRRPERENPAPRAPAALRPWRESSHDRRNLGLAYIAAGTRWQSGDLVQSGFALLAPNQREFERDPEVLGALGYVLMTKQRNAEAVSLLARAVTFAPRDVLLRLNLGLALAGAGRKDAAQRAFQELLELDPTVRAAAIAAKSSAIQPRSDK